MALLSQRAFFLRSLSELQDGEYGSIASFVYYALTLYSHN